ncbi:Vacuolar protein sorting-associated protein 41 [Coemansia sp. RSA 1086]|nr:Vacuolar protein sorting-associated protein 41 [Coemansia sp. RSA 1086]
MSTTFEKIKEIETEMARTQKNKATAYHLGTLKAKLAKLKRELLTPSKSGGGPGEGFDVAGTGVARVGFIGFPSVGKSTLMSKMTGTFSEVSEVEFTTLTTVPGVLQYKGAKIQILDLPGIIEGAKDGKGRGRQVIAVARTCSLIFIVLDVLKPLTHKAVIERELEGVGIRMNKEPPNIVFRKKDKGGINMTNTVPLTHLDKDVVRSILNEYKIASADIAFRCDATADDLIDVIEGNRVYIPAVYVLNKIDQISIEELDLIYKIPHAVPISAHHEWNFDELLEKMWEYLNLVRIYTKPKGQLPDYSSPVVLKQDHTTIAEFCNSIHKGILREFSHALVWGASAKHNPQKVGKDHVLLDEDVVSIQDSERPQSIADSAEYSDQEEEEPALRYKRLGGNVHALFEKDTASTLIAAERFLVLGTHWGNVIIIDFEGNEVKKWRAHSTSVNSVSVDIDNEYVASAGDDGRVVVHGLYTDDVTIVNYSRPVKAVALDPYYSRKASRRFVSGGFAGQLIMYEKKWFGKSDSILFTSTGPIQTIKWQENLIAWACDEGVQIYNTDRGARISQIARPEGSPRPDLYLCRLHWKDDRTLLIGWANFVQMVVLKERLQHREQQSSPALGLVGGEGDSGPLLYAEVSVIFRTDFIVCGLALHRDSFLVFTYGDHEMIESMAAENGGQVPKEERQHRARNAPPPELRMINWNIEEVSSDVLPLEGFQLLQPNDYGLAYCAARAQSTSKPPDSDSSTKTSEADAWFILSPKQLVSVRPRGLADHVQWLTERDEYQQALEAIEEAYRGEGQWAMCRDQIKEAEYQSIGQTYAQMLMDSGSSAEAAAICARVLPRTNTPEATEAWESWIFAFAETSSLHEIAPFIPTDSMQLSSTVYEMVLAFLLTSDVAEFKRLIFTWPASLFNAYSVVLAIEDQYQKSTTDKQSLKEIMAFLYDRLNQPSKSLRCHLELYTPDILGRVCRENLFDAVRDKAELVLQYDDHTLGLLDSNHSDVPLQTRCQAEGVQLLTDNADAIPSSSVVKQLVNSPEHLHVYLHTLLAKDPHLGAPFADLQVELYAEYNPERLLNFLRISTYYSFEKALEICEERGLVPEMVFILGRMGDNHRALMLIIDQLRDVPRAIEFAKEQNDPELWNDLVMYSRDKPEFIIGLLELGGTHTNPTKVIQNIPPELNIPGIRRALTNVLHDYHLQVELCTDCNHVLDGDCKLLSDGLRRLQHQGMEVESDQVCLVCQLPLENMPEGSSNVLAFWCGHIYHDKCILHPDVQRKTQINSLGNSDSTDDLLKRSQRLVRSPAEQRRMLMQAKLDRTMMIRQYNPTCPVCVEYDQKKMQQTRSGWSPSERKDREQSNESDNAEDLAELPPMQALTI